MGHPALTRRTLLPSIAAGAPGDHQRHAPAAGHARAARGVRRAPARRRPDPARGRRVDLRGARRKLRAIGPPVAAVHGNVDDARLRAAPPRRAPGRRGRGAVRDAPRRRSRGRAALGRMQTRFAAPGAAAVVFGHSHIPLTSAIRRPLSDLQPRQPDGPPPPARAHDGPRRRRGRREDRLPPRRPGR